MPSEQRAMPDKILKIIIDTKPTFCSQAMQIYWRWASSVERKF